MSNIRVPVEPLLAAFGVPATVTRPNEAVLETTAIWLTAGSDLAPSGSPYGRREMGTELALWRAAVPTVPVGTVVIAPPKDGGAAVAWRVDAVDQLDADLMRITVVRARDLDP